MDCLSIVNAATALIVSSRTEADKMHLERSLESNGCKRESETVRHIDHSRTDIVAAADGTGTQSCGRKQSKARNPECESASMRVAGEHKMHTARCCLLNERPGRLMNDHNVEETVRRAQSLAMNSSRAVGDRYTLRVSVSREHLSTVYDTRIIPCLYAGCP